MLYAYALAQVFEALSGCRVPAVACLHGRPLDALIAAIRPYLDREVTAAQFRVSSHLDDVDQLPQLVLPIEFPGRQNPLTHQKNRISQLSNRSVKLFDR